MVHHQFFPRPPPCSSVICSAHVTPFNSNVWDIDKCKQVCVPRRATIICVGRLHRLLTVSVCYAPSSIKPCIVGVLKRKGKQRSGKDVTLLRNHHSDPSNSARCENTTFPRQHFPLHTLACRRDSKVGNWSRRVSLCLMHRRSIHTYHNFANLQCCSHLHCGSFYSRSRLLFRFQHFYSLFQLSFQCLDNGKVPG